QDDNNLFLSETTEILEITKNNLLENEIWTEEELSKFKKLYYKENDIEKQNDDNQNLENKINYYKIMILKNLLKKIVSKLITEYSFEGKSIYHFVEQDINLCINSKTRKVGTRAISFEIVIKVITFIENFAKQNNLLSLEQSFCDNTTTIIYLLADTTYSSLHIQYLEAIKTDNQFEISFITFVKIWKKFLPYIKKLTPCSDLCLKCKDMRFNTNYWSNKEKVTKVLEWYKHIKWAHEE
ncbi:9951_t:CDS:2, partial [Gigaspora margarita]